MSNERPPGLLPAPPGHSSSHSSSHSSEESEESASRAVTEVR